MQQRPRSIWPRFSIVLCTLLFILLAAGCGSDSDDADPTSPPPPTADPTAFTTLRNAVGVPHIQSASLEGAAKGLGLAYAQDNFCLVQDNVVTVNGERSRLFGAETLYEYQPTPTTPVKNIDSDFYHRFVIDSDRARAVHEGSDETTRAMLRGYLAGLNQYFTSTPADQLDPACRAYARALTDTDLYRVITDRLTRAGSVAFLKQLAVAPTPPEVTTAAASRRATLARSKPVVPSVEQLQQAMPPRVLASNGWAFGRDVVDPAQGRSVLFGNPHFPYAGIERLYEMRMTVPGQIDVSGVTMLGVPVVVLGYNKDVAWTHTISTASRFTLHELALKPGDPRTYLVDGAEKAMTPVDVSVPLADGSTAMRRFYRTEFGPLFVHPQLGATWSTARAYALQDVNMDNNRAVATWLAVGKARSVRELRDAMGTLRGAPYVNTIASDRAGEVLYGDLSAVPNVEKALIDQCPSVLGPVLAPLSVAVLGGSKSVCHWGRAEVAVGERLLPMDRLPSVIRSDYVANSNDSYWLANPKHTFDATLSPLLGRVGVPQKLRTRAGLALIEGQLANAAPGNKISAEALKTLWSKNDNFAAGLVLDDLLAMIAQSGSTTVIASDSTPVDAASAIAVLTAWDRTSRAAARGAVLFREVWLRLSKVSAVFGTPFDPAQPVTTPRGLDATKRAAVSAALGDAILALQAQNVALDAPLGDVQFIEAAGTRHAIGGGDEFEGVLNKTTTRPLTAGRYAPVHGTSYLQIVTLGDAPTRGEGLLTYSQSTDERSPHANDQLPLWSQLVTRELPTMP
jgi:acyl-homoserine-lactone acylase